MIHKINKKKIKQKIQTLKKNNPVLKWISNIYSGLSVAAFTWTIVFIVLDVILRYGFNDTISIHGENYLPELNTFEEFSYDRINFYLIGYDLIRKIFWPLIDPDSLIKPNIASIFESLGIRHYNIFFGLLKGLIR